MAMTFKDEERKRLRPRLVMRMNYRLAQMAGKGPLKRRALVMPKKKRTP